MTRVFLSWLLVDLHEENRLCRVVALKSAGFILADFQTSKCVISLFSPSRMHMSDMNAFSVDQQLRRWHFVICLPCVNEALLHVAGVADRTVSCIHTFLHQSPSSVVNRQPGSGPDCWAATDLETGKIKSGVSCWRSWTVLRVRCTWWRLPSPGSTLFQTFHHRRPSFSGCRLTDLELTTRHSRFGINTAVVPAPIENFFISTILYLD